MSLSSPQVISLLNRYYVPVYVSNEDYTPGGAATPTEKKELQRIFQEGYAAKLSVGTVHVYVLKPDGRLLDSMHVAQAAKPENLIAMLERSEKKLGTPAGEPIVPPKPAMHSAVEPGTVMLHLTSRYLQRKGDGYSLVETSTGDWSALPSEDWIPLKPAEQAKLLPVQAVIGSSWDVDKETAVRLLQHFYPPTENWESEKNPMETYELKGRVTTLRNGAATAWLEGRLNMKHTFYHKEDNNRAQATIVGWMEFDAKTKRLRTLHLVTDQADYGDKNMQSYGVAVTSEAR